MNFVVEQTHRALQFYLPPAHQHSEQSYGLRHANDECILYDAKHAQMLCFVYYLLKHLILMRFSFALSPVDRHAQLPSFGVRTQKKKACCCPNIHIHMNTKCLRGPHTQCKAPQFWFIRLSRLFKSKHIITYCLCLANTRRFCACTNK